MNFNCVPLFSKIAKHICITMIMAGVLHSDSSHIQQYELIHFQNSGVCVILRPLDISIVSVVFCLSNPNPAGNTVFLHFLKMNE